MGAQMIQYLTAERIVGVIDSP